jgi:septum formation protein
MHKSCFIHRINKISIYYKCLNGNPRLSDGGTSSQNPVKNASPTDRQGGHPQRENLATMLDKLASWLPFLPGGLVSGKVSRLRPREQTEHIHRNIPMALLLASSSAIRIQLLRQAGVEVTPHPARIDETAIMVSLRAEGAGPSDIADTLAEMKARKIAERFQEDTVVGCDQVLAFGNMTWGKPETREEARAQLLALRGQTHALFSAVVLYHRAEPVWRHVGEARLTMRSFSDGYLDAYLARNWDSIRSSVGGYKLEEEGVRLFSAITGDHFTILGLPLLPLLNQLALRGDIAA